MRRAGGGWIWVCWLAVGPLWAATPGRQWPAAFHEDANLFDVCFIDPQQGWAVGDRGTIWHTQDGGESWSLQPCPVACRLESVQFLDARQGWAAGGFTAAYTQRAVGVLLKTEDGGQNWKPVERQFLPWLKHVQFLDPQRGYLLGLPSSMFPAAAFQTRDGGQHWTPWPGQSSGWVHGHFPPQGSGLLLDRHGKMFAAESGEIRPLATAPADPRLPLRIGLDASQRGLLCGNQGLVYSTEDGGRSWQIPRKLPDARGLAEFDWLALDGADRRYWVVGVPGSRVLHTPDGGQSWELFDTGQTLPLYGLEFVDADRGWAVGALGTVLATTDGGRTWSCQRGTGRRLAALGVFGHPDLVPWELWSQMCAGERSFAAFEVLSAPAEGPQSPEHVPLASRLHEAMAGCGGVGANLIQSLPAPELQWQWSADQVKAAWDRAAASDVTPQLTEYLVRQMRLWRPELVVLADPGPQSPGLTQLTHRIALRAVELSADPQQFPEQIQRAGLPAWRVARVATQTDDLAKAGYKVTASRQSLAWGQSVGSLADQARSLIDHTYQPGAAQLGLIVADGQAARAERGSDLLAARTARERQALQRPEGRLPDNLQQLHDQYQRRRNIESLLRSSDEIPTARWPQIARLSEGLSPADRGEVLYQAAMQALRRGNAPLAWDLLTQLTREIPDHPLAEAARLELFRRAASVEASLHWPVPTTSRAEQTVGELPVSEPAASIDLTSLQTPVAATDRPAVVQTTQQAVGQADTATPQTLRLAEQLREQQPDLYFEPCVRFPLAAALLRAGQPQEATRLWRNQINTASASTWRACAARELAWQQQPGAESNEPVWRCRKLSPPPHLDGQLDEASWNQIPWVALQRDPAAPGPTCATEVRLAYDTRFLYLAARCRGHSEAPPQSPLQPRQRDADVTHRDRLEWYLDIDRDYATWWHLTIDDRGWACDRLNQDMTWNPTWYIAVRSDEQTWTVEAAIPLQALAPDPVTTGSAWRLGCERIVPGVGRQTWTGVPRLPLQPQDFGLLVFD